jgi:hypothetical protein
MSVATLSMAEGLNSCYQYGRFGSGVQCFFDTQGGEKIRIWDKQQGSCFRELSYNSLVKILKFFVNSEFRIRICDPGAYLTLDSGSKHLDPGSASLSATTDNVECVPVRYPSTGAKLSEYLIRMRRCAYGTCLQESDCLDS